MLLYFVTVVAAALYYVAAPLWNACPKLWWEEPAIAIFLECSHDWKVSRCMLVCVCAWAHFLLRLSVAHDMKVLVFFWKDWKNFVEATLTAFVISNDYFNLVCPEYGCIYNTLIQCFPLMHEEMYVPYLWMNSLTLCATLGWVVFDSHDLKHWPKCFSIVQLACVNLNCWLFYLPNEHSYSYSSLWI